jgi:hypothetical protein
MFPFSSRLAAHVSVVVAACALSFAAHADDKDPPKKDGAGAKEDAKGDSAVDAFFDDPGTVKKKSNLDALHEAAKDMAHTKKKGLAPKAAVVDDEAKVQFFSAFAAQKIVIDKKLGCQVAGRDKKKLTYFAFDEVPAEGVPFSVCLTMQSKAGREMAMSVSIVDPRNSRVVKAEDVVDFRGRTQRMDHILDFPAPVFKLVGPYQYVVELDGKEVARLPIFEVKIDSE